MNVEKDVLDIWKERIKNEAKHGDKKKHVTLPERHHPHTCLP